MHTKLHGTKTGFTLPELLIVIAIVSIMASVFLSGYPRFGEMLAIDREAQLIALAVRDIEQRAVSTLESPIGPSGQFKTAYGVHFSVANVADSKRYWLFSDAVDPDRYFTDGEEIEIVPIGRGVRIRKICKLSTASSTCDTVIGELKGLSVTYKRPSPIIEVRGARSLLPGIIEDLGPGSYMVEIESRDGSFRRRIIMWTTGAVAIKKAP